jgi:hypothetical protein
MRAHYTNLWRSLIVVGGGPKKKKKKKKPPAEKLESWLLEALREESSAPSIAG